MSVVIPGHPILFFSMALRVVEKLARSPILVFAVRIRFRLYGSKANIALKKCRYSRLVEELTRGLISNFLYIHGMTALRWFVKRSLVTLPLGRQCAVNVGMSVLFYINLEVYAQGETVFDRSCEISFGL